MNIELVANPSQIESVVGEKNESQASVDLVAQVKMKVKVELPITVKVK